jgi:hypothetical protein
VVSNNFEEKIQVQATVQEKDRSVFSGVLLFSVSMVQSVQALAIGCV